MAHWVIIKAAHSTINITPTGRGPMVMMMAMVMQAFHENVTICSNGAEVNPRGVFPPISCIWARLTGFLYSSRLSLQRSVLDPAQLHQTGSDNVIVPLARFHAGLSRTGPPKTALDRPGPAPR